MKYRMFGISVPALAVILSGCGDGTEMVAPPAAADVSTIDGTRLASFTGNPLNGGAVFGQCRACHSVTPGQNRVGPSLHGVVGRRAGTAPGFSYSPVNAGAGYPWSPEKLNQFLENPRRVLPGTRMAYAGLRDPQHRVDVIAYLAEQR